jgi:CRISPR-associated protein Cas1
VNNRLLDFAETAAILSAENGLLVVRQGEEIRERIPVADIAAVIASHRQVVFTQHALAELGRAGAIVVCCDARHIPVSMLLPLEAHFAQAERFRAQAAAGAPVKKRIWQELVRAKLAAQEAVLVKLYGVGAGLGEMARRVRSGDPENVEAAGAQRYWLRLFGDTKFRRGAEEDGRNYLLNYGYGVVRAICARAVCGAGLHPSLGVNHSNRYNAFCLADDLMEPFRPLVDYAVARWCSDEPREGWALGKTTKAVLLGAAAMRYRTAGESRSLFDIAGRRAQSLARALTGEGEEFRCEAVELP